MKRFTAQLALCYQLVNSTITNYVSSSTIAAGSMSPMGEWVMSNAIDDDRETFFYTQNEEIDQTLQLDLGSSKSVRSIYMMPNDALDYPTTYDVYIGNTPYTMAAYSSSNTKCLTGVGRFGLGNCAGTGRYVIWEMKDTQA